MNKRVLLLFVLVISILAWVALQRSQERPNVLDKEARPSVQSADQGKEAAQSKVAEAQPPARIPRIGFLTSGPPEALIDEFRKALQALGYVDGKNVVIEARGAGRSGEGAERQARLRMYAEELVRLNVDIIATTEPASARAAQRASRTIPIVGVLGNDPVALGLVASLARPGANITGTTNISAVGTKRLELLKEVAAQISPVAVLWMPIAWTGGQGLQMRDIESAARSLGLELQSTPVHEGNFESAFAAIEKAGARSLILLSSATSSTERNRIVALATRSRLPAMYPYSSFVDAGGLMSYGVNPDELHRHQALYVDRILKGAKPADLPIEVPEKFELVVNLKAAKQIGLTIPESVLHRADRIVE